jgi:hypothetical protein
MSILCMYICIYVVYMCNDCACICMYYVRMFAYIYTCVCVCLYAWTYLYEAVGVVYLCMQLHVCILKSIMFLLIKKVKAMI